MHRIKKAAAVLVTFLLTGCAASQKDGSTPDPESMVTSMETEPELAYEVPDSSPGILINQLGYITEGTKVAIFCGEEMPENFKVIRKDTGEEVFTGYLEDKGYNAETQEYNSYGDFSEVCDPGTYYIEAPILGQSYSFTIGDGLYNDIFREAFKQFYYNRCGMTLSRTYAGDMAHSACHTGKASLREDSSVSLNVSGGWHQDEKGSREVASAARNMGILMLSYELYGDSFTDDMGIPESGNGVPDILDEIRYEVEWLLKMQDDATGGVYRGVTVQARAGGRGPDIFVEPADVEAARAFAMALARFSYLYQNYDTEYASRCLKAADYAWQYALQNEEDEEGEKSEGWKFAAAAELYRASGVQACRRYVSEYLSRESYKEDMTEEVFLGCVTYISTRQPVELELCEEIARTLMLRAEEISEGARSSVYLTEGNEAQDNNQELLDNMMYLTMIDHMITNSEYENIIENHLHYFLGRNKKAISYIDHAGEKNYMLIDEELGIMGQPDEDSKLIFMLSEIVGSHEQ